MPLYDLARERQTNPRPSPVVLAFMQTAENLKDQVLVVFRDADAIVPNVIVRRMARLHADLDPAAGLVIVLDGVPDEIDEDIADPFAIAQGCAEPRRPADANAAFGQSVTEGQQSQNRQPHPNRRSQAP